MARPDVEIQEQKPSPGDEADTARAIWELSQYEIARVYAVTKTVTASYTIDPVQDRVIIADATGGALTVTWPAADAADYVRYTVVRANSGANAVTVATTGAATINGAATVVLGTQFDTLTAVSDNTNYFRTDQ